MIVRKKNNIERLKKNLFERLDYKDKLRKIVDDYTDKINHTTYNARKDKGESVPDLPQQPVAIVPLGDGNHPKIKFNEDGTWEHITQCKD